MIQRLKRKDRLKIFFKNRLLDLVGIVRIHIVGCARSGTTLLHYSFAAFEKTHLYGKETSVKNAPSVRQSIALSLLRLTTGQPGFFVTKRASTWFEPDKIKLMLSVVKAHKYVVVYILRDPRDVLTSRHYLKPGKYYVQPATWLASINTLPQLQRELEPLSKLLILRYEDIINYPARELEKLQRFLKIRLRPEINDWSNLAENLKILKVSQKMVPYLNRLRNFDPSTTGRWVRDEASRKYIAQLQEHHLYGPAIDRFIKEYGYQPIS